MGARPYLRIKNVQWTRIDVRSTFFEMDCHRGSTLERFSAARRSCSSARAAIAWSSLRLARTLDWTAIRRGISIASQPQRRDGVGIPAGMPSPWLAQTNASKRMSAGTTIEHFSQEDLRCFAVPLPPLNEQRRIVAAIEEHLSRLDAADASLVASAEAPRRLRSTQPLRTRADDQVAEHRRLQLTDRRCGTSPQAPPSVHRPDTCMLPESVRRRRRSRRTSTHVRR